MCSARRDELELEDRAGHWSCGTPFASDACTRMPAPSAGGDPGLRIRGEPLSSSSRIARRMAPRPPHALERRKPFGAGDLAVGAVGLDQACARSEEIAPVRALRHQREDGTAGIIGAVFAPLDGGRHRPPVASGEHSRQRFVELLPWTSKLGSSRCTVRMASRSAPPSMIQLSRGVGVANRLAEPEMRRLMGDEPVRACRASVGQLRRQRRSPFEPHQDEALEALRRSCSRPRVSAPSQLRASSAR